MFRSLRIQNFKAWRDTKEVRLAPLTVLFGTNSSGKTSLAQMLLMLKQTAQSPDRKRVLHPGDENTPVDLGTFHDMVFNHDLDSPIGFQLNMDLPAVLRVKDPKAGLSYHGDALTFEAEVGRDGGVGQPLAARHLRYTLLRAGEPQLSVGMQPHEGKPGKYDLFAEPYTLVRAQGRKWLLPPPVRFYGFPDEAVAYYQNSGFVSDLSLALEKQLGDVHYLGPLREYPKRSYTWSGETPEHVGWRGERAIEALLSGRERQLSAGYRKRARSFEEVVAEWLKRMGLIQEFVARPIAEHRKEYEVLVKTARSSKSVNLTDVGFGVSQVLPVLVQCLYAQPGSTIIFEQPEIHLHPRVQAALADFFIEVIHSREAGVDRKIQLIVESHSEHFLRRIQRRVAETALSRDEAALYFCEPGPRGASIRELAVDEYGNITNWPKDFFGDEVGDLAAMTEAAMKRQLGGGKR